MSMRLITSWESFQIPKEVEMKSWKPKLKFFPFIQDDEVSSWLHTMILEHKNSGKETDYFLYSKNGS